MLGVTSIDPIKHELLFERFVSGERREPPDIDVDFEHERREEIIQWIYETYGRDRAALGPRTMGNDFVQGVLCVRRAHECVRRILRNVLFILIFLSRISGHRQSL